MNYISKFLVFSAIMIACIPISAAQTLNLDVYDSDEISQIVSDLAADVLESAEDQRQGLLAARADSDPGDLEDLHGEIINVCSAIVREFNRYPDQFAQELRTFVAEDLSYDTDSLTQERALFEVTQRAKAAGYSHRTQILTALRKLLSELLNLRSKVGNSGKVLSKISEAERSIQLVSALFGGKTRS